MHCLLTEHSKFTLLKDGSETYQVCMHALSSYRVQQVYTAQGRHWNIPGRYGCIVSLPSTASLRCSRTAVKHTRYVWLHCFLTEYSKFTLLKDGSETYEGCMINSWTFVAILLFAYWFSWNLQKNIINMCLT